MSAHERLAAMIGEFRAPAAELRDADLLRRLDLLGEAKRLIDALGVAATIEVANRTVTPPGQPMSRAFGSKSAADVVADHVGISLAEARGWSRVASAVEQEVSLVGEVLPPRFPAIEAALETGALSVGCADAVIHTIGEVRAFLSPDAVLGLEAHLVDEAPTLSRREFQKLCRRTPEHLMPEGIEFREALQRARSGLRITQTDDGMTRLVAMLHPEAAGFVLTALDARTAPRRQPSFLDGDLEVERDPRGLDQQRLDALVAMSRESVAHDDGRIAGTAVTMCVTVPLDVLRSGLGAAEIVGIDETISASTARRLAADAEIIPCVLGGPSAVLDEGRAFRLFTDAQRRAIAVRDGRCVWPGCEAPPSWCEIAHLVSWLDGGGTDLDNGVLLCPFHHRCFDNDDWLLEWRGGELWLIPPPHVDATRTPRRAGRRELVT